MTWLVTTALRLRVLVLALCVVLSSWAPGTLRSTPFDVFPELRRPLVEIQTERPAYRLRRSKASITHAARKRAQRHARSQNHALEVGARAVAGRSRSSTDGTDPIRARQLVQERLTPAASRLPAICPAAGHAPPLRPRPAA